MKKIILVMLGAALLARHCPAANSDVEIHCVARKVDEVNKSSTESMAHLQEHWTYEVTVENKTFKELSAVEVAYQIFYKKEELGNRKEDKPQRQTGTVTIGVLKPHEKKSFTTNAVELKKAHLNNGYYYPDGGRQAAQDSLVGVWVRLTQGGQQFAEYSNPSTLLREKWE